MSTSFLSRFAVGLAAGLCAATLSTIARTQPLGEWRGDFSIPAFDGPVSAALVFEGAPIVGGDFRWAAGVRATNIARWDGQSWRPLGDGLPAPVSRLVEFDGRIVAGLQARDAVPPLMAWDGRDWQPLGSGLSGDVTAVFGDGPQLLVGGNLALEGLPYAPRVVRWDGGRWSTMGDDFDGRVLCLSRWNDTLYAGGEFLSGDAGFASRIARFDGSHWQGVGGGTGAGGGVRVAALAVWNGRLAAGGTFASMGGVPANGLATWDGSGWSAVSGTPEDVMLEDMLVDGEQLLVAGVLQKTAEWASGVATVDAAGWHVPDPHPGWGVRSLAARGGRVLAVGSFADLAGTSELRPVRHVLIREAGTWSALEPWHASMRGLLGPSATVVYALREYGGDLYAGGYFQHAAVGDGWRRVGSIARWNGDAWEPIGDIRAGLVRGFAEWSGRLVVAGHAQVGLETVSLAHLWDGHAWSSIGGPLQGDPAAVTVWRDSLVLGGSLRLGDGPVRGVFLRRGEDWVSLEGLTLSTYGQVTSLAAHGNDLFAAGYGLELPGVGAIRVARWSGGAWRELPGSQAYVPAALLSLSDGLWAAGSDVGGGNPVKRWTGAAWESVGSLLGVATSLVAWGDRIYVGGMLGTIAGSTTLACWDGREWQPVPGAPERSLSGMSQIPLALAVHGDELWLGGQFTRVASAQSEGLARWKPFRSPVPTPRGVAFSRVWPCPARDAVTFRFVLAADAPARLTIHDLRGAIVATVAEEWLGAGSYERAWRIPPGADRPRAGVYFARLLTPSGEAAVRVVVE